MLMDNENISELDTIWDEARKYIIAGNYEKAIEIYNYILVRYADNPVAAEYAHAYLGDIYLTSQKLDMAEEHIKKAIKYQPEKPNYHYISGFVYTHKKQWNEAIPEFELAVAKEPDNAEFLRGLGWATYQKGDRQKGLVLLHRANDIEPNNINILTDLAVAYLAGDINLAKKYAEMAMIIEPGNTLVNNVWNTVLKFDEEFSRSSNRSQIAGAAESEPDINADSIYQFKISLQENPDIWRIIEIKYDERLSTLHKAIFKAFNRQNERAYSFFLSGDPENKRNEFASSLPGTTGMAKLAARLQIDSIFLYIDEGQKFLYLFDYTEKVWHEVEFLGTTRQLPRSKYPRVMKRQGRTILHQ
jgi:tetratricopeptide (TPR) repeat protein